MEIQPIITAVTWLISRICHYCMASWPLCFLSPPGQVIRHLTVINALLKTTMVVCVGLFWQVTPDVWDFWGDFRHFRLRWGIKKEGSSETETQNPQQAMAKVTQSHEKDTATWKVMPFGNGCVKMKGLFKSVRCLLIPAVMYGLGSEMRCSL